MLDVIVIIPDHYLSVHFEELYDQKQYISFATVLCLIPENVYGRLYK